MKRHDANHLLGAGLRLLGEFARSRGLSLNDPVTQDRLLNELGKMLAETKESPIRLHGFRVQAMFSYVAAALGNCTVITEEDSGTFFEAAGGLTRPDFRLITCDRQQFFVEVKNHYDDNPLKPYAFRTGYLRPITRYANEMGFPLKFAIYWARWNTWTLTDASTLPKGPSTLRLPFAEALKKNEMGILGDVTIGTIPPLSLRIDADPRKPRKVNDAGDVEFTIGKAVFYSGGTEITEPDEIRLAWMFMLHGKWTDYRSTPIIRNQLLEAIEFSVSPEVRSEEQEFEVIGSMSQIITNQYLEATSAGRDIRGLAPENDPHHFGAIIPRDYEGRSLHLWRFTQIPNLDDPSSSEKPASE